MGPPDVFDLPLASGITEVSKSFYYKTDINQGFVRGDLQKTSGTFQNLEVVAILPEGFRPKFWGRYVAAFNDGTGYTVGTVTINEQGQILMGGSGVSKNAIFFDVVFVLAD